VGFVAFEQRQGSFLRKLRSHVDERQVALLRHCPSDGVFTGETRRDERVTDAPAGYMFEGSLQCREVEDPTFDQEVTNPGSIRDLMQRRF
jgi:hypothetical protein